MSEINNQQITFSPFGFVKENFTELTKLIIKYSVLIYILQIFLEIIQTHTTNLPYLYFLMYFLSIIILCCAHFSLITSVTRKIMFNESLSGTFIKNMYSSTTIKLFSSFFIYAALGFIFVFIPLVIKNDYNATLGTVLLLVGSIIASALVIRLVTLNTDIIASNKIRIKYNLQLTKGSTVRILGIMFLCLCPLIIMNAIITFLFTFINSYLLDFIAHSNNFNSWSSIASTFISSIYTILAHSLSMFINVIVNSAITLLYLQFVSESSLDHDSLLSASQTNVTIN